MTERDLHLLHCKKTSKTTYFNIKMFTQHAHPKMSGRDRVSLQQSENSAISNHSQGALGRLQILSRGLQLLPSKRLGDTGNIEAQLPQEAGQQGKHQSIQTTAPPCRTSKWYKATHFWRAQLYPREQVNKRLSNV